MNQQRILARLEPMFPVLVDATRGGHEDFERLIPAAADRLTELCSFLPRLHEKARNYTEFYGQLVPFGRASHRKTHAKNAVTADEMMAIAPARIAMDNRCRLSFSFW